MIVCFVTVAVKQYKLSLLTVSFCFVLCSMLCLFFVVVCLCHDQVCQLELLNSGSVKLNPVYQRLFLIECMRVQKL